MIERTIERLILASRWLLVPLYVSLILILVIFGVKAAQEIIHLFATVIEVTETDLILATLSLVDMVLVANLLMIVALSSYEAFVSRLDADKDAETPTWLGKMDPAAVKIKLAISIVSISAIHLLQVFVNVQNYSSQQVMWVVIIHLTFVVSALLLALIDRIAFAHHRD